MSAVIVRIQLAARGAIRSSLVVSAVALAVALCTKPTPAQSPNQKPANSYSETMATPDPADVVVSSFEVVGNRGTGAADDSQNPNFANMAFPAQPGQVFTTSAQDAVVAQTVTGQSLRPYDQYLRRRMREGVNHVLRIVPRSSPDNSRSPLYTYRPFFQSTQAPVSTPPAPASRERPMTAPAAPPPTTQEAPSLLPEFTLSATGSARVNVIADSTKMNGATSGAFLPASIPVQGQPFFGAPARANLTGNGTTLNLTLGTEVAGTAATVNTGIAVPATDTGTSLELQQSFLQLGQLVVGSVETAFGDNDALPMTLDLAGPNARVTVLQGGTGAGQGRLSYFLIPQSTTGPGFELQASMEQPTPEIANGPNAALAKNTSTFSRYPDFIGTLRYGGSIYDSGKYEESWHVKLTSVIRDLGIENANQSFERHVTGWGLSLSGHYEVLTPSSNLPDAFVGSITYGQGIAHYISDLHTPSASLATVGNDAVLSATHSLDALTDFGYYVGYMHNWSDYFETTAAYSHVTLDSLNVGQAQSPYRFGDYFSINLLYHVVTTGSLWPPAPPPSDSKLKHYTFATGVEYLYGRKETLNDHAGDDQRIMWVTEVQN